MQYQPVHSSDSESVDLPVLAGTAAQAPINRRTTENTKPNATGNVPTTPGTPPPSSPPLPYILVGPINSTSNGTIEVAQTSIQHSQITPQNSQSIIDIPTERLTPLSRLVPRAFRTAGVIHTIPPPPITGKRSRARCRVAERGSGFMEAENGFEKPPMPAEVAGNPDYDFLEEFFEKPPEGPAVGTTNGPITPPLEKENQPTSQQPDQSTVLMLKRPRICPNRIPPTDSEEDSVGSAPCQPSDQGQMITPQSSAGPYPTTPCPAKSPIHVQIHTDDAPHAESDKENAPPEGVPPHPTATTIQHFSPREALGKIPPIPTESFTDDSSPRPQMATYAQAPQANAMGNLSPTSGDETDDGEEVLEGDSELEVISPWFLMYDPAEPDGDQEPWHQFRVGCFFYSEAEHYPYGKSKNYTGSRAGRPFYPPLTAILPLRMRLGLFSKEVYRAFCNEARCVYQAQRMAVDPSKRTKSGNRHLWNTTLEILSTSRYLPSLTRDALMGVQEGPGIWSRRRRIAWHSLDSLVTQAVKYTEASLKKADKAMTSFYQRYPEWGKTY